MRSRCEHGVTQHARRPTPHRPLATGLTVACLLDAGAPSVVAPVQPAPPPSQSASRVAGTSISRSVTERNGEGCYSAEHATTTATANATKSNTTTNTAARYRPPPAAVTATVTLTTAGISHPPPSSFGVPGDPAAAAADDNKCAPRRQCGGTAARRAGRTGVRASGVNGQCGPRQIFGEWG